MGRRVDALERPCGRPAAAIAQPPDRDARDAV